MDKKPVQSAWDKYKREIKLGKGLASLSFSDIGFSITIKDTDWDNKYSPKVIEFGSWLPVDLEWSLFDEIICDEGLIVEGYEAVATERIGTSKSRIYYERT